jgi:hypothetical protein
MCDLDTLQKIDSATKGILESTAIRARATSYRRKLAVLLEPFMGLIIVPAIRYEGSPIQVAARQLRQTFNGHVLADEAPYLDEAIKCVTVRSFRAAIIMLWAAAISRFHRSIEGLGFTAYNKAHAATISKAASPYNRVSKSSPISSLPELQRVREFDILVVGMEIWKYDLQTFEELDRQLGIRNTAAHPGMVVPTVADVQQFAAKLDTLVFSYVKV